MAVTMKQVAERAGVSAPVVSMVLNGSVGTIGVSAVKAQRVREVAEELGYRTDWKAASLRKGRTNLIGMLSATHIGTRTHHGDLLRGIDEALAAEHCHLAFASVLPGKDDMLRDGRFDGCLIDYVIEPAQIEAVKAVRLPCVIINARGRRGVPCVRLDQRGAAETAVEHLIAHGHQRFCFLGIVETEGEQYEFDRECHAARLNGFRAATRAAGVAKSARIDRLPQLYHDPERSPRMIADLPSVRALAAAAADAPTAFVCYDHHMAMLLREGLALLGFACPADYSLVSLHDNRMFESLSVPVTAMRANYARLGFLAASRLLAQIERQAKRRRKEVDVDPAPPPPRDEVIAFELQDRGSVAAPRGTA